MVDTPLVRSLPRRPFGHTEDGERARTGHRTSVGAFEGAARAGGI
jgi:hypothetical protein